MKQSKGKRAQAQKKTAPVANIYFRLCHVCFHLNEASEPIEKCEVCDNEYANPFLQDFYESEDEDSQTESSADLEEGETLTRKENLVILRRTITGLSVVW